ncbi:MAG: hypothetical protein WD894_05210 [Pirellulales bacterium]
MPLPSEPDPNQALNQVLITLHRSLPMYISFADPWVAYGNEEPRRVLNRLVADKQEYVGRLTTLLDSRRYTIDFGEFPMDFTSLHDVSLDFLLKQLIEHQRREVEAIENRLGRLARDAEGGALVGEILTNSRRHLQSLEGLSRQAATANAER